MWVVNIPAHSYGKGVGFFFFFYGPKVVPYGGFFCSPMQSHWKYMQGR